MGRLVQSSPIFLNSRLKMSPASRRPSSGVSTPTRTSRSTISVMRSGSRVTGVCERKRQKRMPMSARSLRLMRKSNSSRSGWKTWSSAKRSALSAVARLKSLLSPRKRRGRRKALPTLSMLRSS